ncbi:riboflavin synthase [Anaerobium acetethylicum]|uniref:Riboflavin synthase n=1 Tax=Anaerobium acetethylicum TaxID=1619234 RepID=A0A1D3TXZ2_9FIRM|nr:riboflavin synthase [Anaerobium acetethylicum]SCP99243.1 riboflavin synthase [Anaerobium acetethylicum]
MFTGIVEETGEIISIKKGAKSSILTIKGNVIFSDLKIGDSVAVNGVCLTATACSGNTFTADVMSETLSRSSLGALKSGSRVNLERAMRADGRFGGHMVSGHIDGTGTVSDIRKDDNAVWYTIRTTEKVMRYIVEKGSISIDGISLTVAAVNKENFSVSVIPHTLKATILGDKKAGSIVNLENDIVGKYIEKFMAPPQAEQKQSGITMGFLAKAGF